MKFNKTTRSTREIVAWLWRHHKGCRMQAAVNVLCGLGLVALGLCGVEAIRLLTDIATGARPGSLALTAVALAVILIAELGLHVLSTWVQAVLGVRSQNQLQQFFFHRILRGRWQGVERFHSGDVLNRLFGDVGDIVRLLTEVLPFAIVTITQFVASFVYLYIMDWALAVILIIVSPLFVALSRYYFSRMRRIVRRIKDTGSALQAIIQENVQHRMVVKVMEQEARQVARLERRQQLLRRQVKARARLAIFTKSLVHIGFAGGYLVALVYGLFQLQQGLITVGVLMAFTQLIHRIQRPMVDMARLLPTFVGSFTSCERLMEIEELPLEPAALPASGEAAWEDTAGALGIRFSEVSFAYADTRKPVLSHFSYDFLPGTTTAVLGATGAGKTTLLRLMLALVEPCEGSVTLVDHSGRTSPVSIASRHLFSYVPQGNTLFSGTIGENLRLGNPAATQAQMEQALRTAQADFVLRLPHGLGTRCGEGGGGLSEGQAQRIAIARALLRPCRFLLLDEATSALDIDTENTLLTHLKSHLKDTTIIFVTHRLAVAEFADRQFTLAPLPRSPHD